MAGVSLTKAINTCMLIVSCTYCRGLFRFLDAVVDPTLTAFYILNDMTNKGRTEWCILLAIQVFLGKGYTTQNSKDRG